MHRRNLSVTGVSQLRLLKSTNKVHKTDEVRKTDESEFPNGVGYPNFSGKILRPIVQRIYPETREILRMNPRFQGDYISII